VARHLVKSFRTVVGCSRNEADWELEGFEHHTTDITDERAVASLVRHIQKTHGRLDAVVNAAGLGPIANHSLLTPVTTLDRFLRNNVVGTFVVCRESAKAMRRRRAGRIVNFSSISAPLRLQGESAYVASKGAVEALSQVLAVELAEFGITVNVLGPTPIETEGLADVPQDKLDAMVASFPVPRMGTFADVINVVDFFLDPRSDAITGQVIYLGGVPNG
jgi:3-oxoacyl-[acyl-carrier protein] reductase